MYDKVTTTGDTDTYVETVEETPFRGVVFGVLFAMVFWFGAYFLIRFLL